MGEISEMIQEGILCQECGGLVGEEPIEAGHPRSCEYCDPNYKPITDRKTKWKKVKALNEGTGDE